MSDHDLAFPIRVAVDAEGASLDAGVAIPGPGRRLTVTHRHVTLHVDLDDRAVAELLRVLSTPHPLTPASEWFDESAAIVNSGRCRCTDDESCWDHEALEMLADGSPR